MFAFISFILAFIFSTSVLPNGIRLTELQAEGDVVEIVAGYQTVGAVYDRPTDRALALIAYSAGGEAQFLTEVERSGLRMRIPSWAKSMAIPHLGDFFKAAPVTGKPAARPTEFRDRVEEEIRDALLGLQADTPQFGTDQAFLSMTGPIPADLQQELAAIPKRVSRPRSEIITSRLPAQRTFRLTADSAEGAVIFASPVPSVYYDGWYRVLLLDRLILRTLSTKPKTELKLSLYPYYYRLELAVPAGQFPEPVEEALLQDLERLQFSRAKPEDLDAARRSALDYLETRDVKQWFATQGILDRHPDGVQWLRSFTADDMRIAARDMLLQNRVIVTWPPKPLRTTAQVEILSARPPLGEGSELQRAGEGDNSASISLPPFPDHADSRHVFTVPERIPSGVSLVPSVIEAIYVAGEAVTTNDVRDLAKFRQYRPDRILILTPQSSLAAIREMWNAFEGNSNDRTEIAPLGNVATGDLAALFLLKTLVDRRIIESGLWNTVQLRIDARSGSSLLVEPDSQRSRISSFIKLYAGALPTEAEMAWAREAAAHHLSAMLPHLQAITWQRDRLGVLQDLQTVGAGHVRDVARIYF